MKQHIPTFRMMLVVILLTGLFAVVGVASSQSPETAGTDAALVPDAPTSLLFSYQGQLMDTNGDPITNPAVDMTFKLYDVAELGSACWTEDYTGADAIDVEDGLFNVLLGQITAIDTACLAGDVYLELVVEDETLSPRELLASVLHAQEATTLPNGATTAGDLAIAGIAHIGEDNTGEGGEIRLAAGTSGNSWIVENRYGEFRLHHDGTAYFSVESNGNVIMSGDQLHIDHQTSADIKFANNDYIHFSDDNDTYPTGGAFIFTVDDNSNPATGNASLLVGQIGINTTNPTGKLDINGSLRAGYDTDRTSFIGRAAVGNVGEHNDWASFSHLDRANDDGGYGLTQNSAGRTIVNAAYGQPLEFRIDNSTKMYLGSDGNIGIGTTNPQANLSVGMSGVSSSTQVGHGTSDMVEIGWDGYPYIQAQDSHTPNGYGLALNPSGGNVGIGTTNPQHGRVQITTNSFPLAFQESGQTGAGSLWRMPLDGKYLRYDVSQNGTDWTNIKTPLSMYADGHITLGGDLNMNGHTVSNCGALTEANLQTAEELASERIERFEEGDVLCWSTDPDQLELCATSGDSLIMAVADAKGRPIVMGAEPIKVLGPVKVGDYLVASDVPGYATATDNPAFGNVIAQALEDFGDDRGLIKAMIRKM